MKHILIAGAGSYIGSALEHRLDPKEYRVSVLDVQDPSWEQADFSGFDTVVHIAAIVHQKERSDMEELYFRVNRDLALRCARKARAQGVGQFLFMSSMSVYGMDTGVITPDTVPAPVTFYGKSKLAAENLLRCEADDRFRVCILRPPMVYGPGCKGNFQTVVQLVKKLPVFPLVRNRRSMIHVDNLVEFIKLCIDRELEGLYFPQNREYVQTSHMAHCIAQKLGKRIFFSRLLGLGVLCIRPFVGTAKKAFGTLIYENTERHGYSYCVREQDSSIFHAVK